MVPLLLGAAAIWGISNVAEAESNANAANKMDIVIIHFTLLLRLCFFSLSSTNSSSVLTCSILVFFPLFIAIFY